MKIEIDASFLNEINRFLFSNWQMLKDTGHKEMADALYEKFCGPISSMLESAGYFRSVHDEYQRILKENEWIMKDQKGS